MQERIAGIEPTKRRKQSIRIHTESVSQFVQPRGHWQNSIVTNQSIDLLPEGPERDQVNQSKHSQEPGPRVEVGGPADSIFSFSPEQPCDIASERTMSGDESIQI